MGGRKKAKKVSHNIWTTPKDISLEEKAMFVSSQYKYVDAHNEKPPRVNVIYIMSHCFHKKLNDDHN
jgi:hypothetical protein